MNRRRGYALIEMVAALSAIAAVFGICIAMIHSMLGLDRSARVHATEAVVVDRLARQFRQDVHSSPNAQSLGQSRLELRGSDRPTITYEATPSSVVRTERIAERIVRREAYRLPTRGTSVFQLETRDDLTFAIMIVPKSKPGKFVGFPREARVETLVGKDQRPLSQGAGSP